MKIRRKAIYPSPCSFFLSFLTLLIGIHSSLSLSSSLLRALSPFPLYLLLSSTVLVSPFSVVLPHYFIHTLNGNRVLVPDERLVPSLDGNRGTFIRHGDRVRTAITY